MYDDAVDAPSRRDQYFHHRDTAVDRSPSPPRQRRPSGGRRRQDSADHGGTSPASVTARSTVPSHWSDTLNLAGDMPSSVSTRPSAAAAAAAAVVSVVALRLVPAAAAVVA